MGMQGDGGCMQDDGGSSGEGVGGGDQDGGSSGKGVVGEEVGVVGRRMRGVGGGGGHR